MKRDLPEIVGTLGTLTVGYRLFGWDDYYHLAMGPLALGGLWLLARRVQKRRARHLPPPRLRQAGRGQGVVRGAVKGTVCLGLLAGLFPLVAALTPVEDWVYGRPCAALVDKLATLRQVEAWKGVVDLIDTRLQAPAAPDCRTILLHQKGDALVGWAEQLRGEERIAKLAEAGQVATEGKDAALQQRITAELQAARAAMESAQKDDVIRQQREGLARNQTLLAELQSGRFDARETERGLVVKLTDAQAVLFAPGKADLTPAAQGALAELATFLSQAEVRRRRVSVEGHTDATGHGALHQRLSEARAMRVAETLVQRGVSKERLSVQGYGASRPVAANDTAEGRQQNRRVEIIIAH